MRCRYDSVELGGLNDKPNPPGEVTRYPIDPAAGNVQQTRLLDKYALDFPVVPQHLVAKPTKFCYTSGNEYLPGPRGEIKCAAFLLPCPHP